jgi:hypothetical protein
MVAGGLGLWNQREAVLRQHRQERVRGNWNRSSPGSAACLHSTSYAFSMRPG